jgi:hypothetical protein
MIKQCRRKELVNIKLYDEEKIFNSNHGYSVQL